MENYKLSDETKTTPWGVILHRIVATTTFTLAIGITINAGDTGGWIEKESNLSGNAWVSGDAWVYGNAKVYGNALVSDNAKVSGDAKVYGVVEVYGDARIKSQKDYIVFKNSWSSGRYFTYTKSNKMWKVGCFYGTSQELIEKAYGDSEDSGNHYKACVDFVETLEQLRK